MKNNDFIKNTIKKELNRYSGKLNVFDFDDTLISDISKIYIIKPNGNKITLTSDEYKKYNKLPEDKVDITEFSTINEPIINWEMMNLLKSLQDTSIILTARTISEPIEKFLETLNIHVPVFAIGTDDPNLICSSYNSRMKSEWLRKAILKFNIKEIEFWDDNKMNIYAVDKLGEELNINIITHKVDFNPKRI